MILIRDLKLPMQKGEPMDSILSPARHAAVATSTPGQLAWRWVRTFRWYLLLLFLSDFGRDIIRRKYDAITTDRAYGNRPSGPLLVGKLIDWIVLRQALHEALRLRLSIVVSELVRLARESERKNTGPVRILSGPSGLARDLLLGAKTLREDAPLPGRLELWAVDLDFSGEVLAEATRRAEAVDVDLVVLKEDLLNPTGLQRTFQEKPLHVFNSMGLTPWLDIEDVVKLFETAHSLLVPEGALLIDNFRVSPQSKFSRDLEIHTRYHTDRDFEEGLRSAGFEIERKQETRNHINVVYTARKRS